MAKIKIFACNICGEVYIGEEIPKICPFCGVLNKHLRLANIWEDKNDVKLSPISKKNLEEALKIELSNTSFYKCASKTLSNKEASLMFKGLFKVEREHASVFKKILKLEEVPEVEEKCINDVRVCLEESYARENMAVKFYAKALAEAIEPRIKEVFEAIMLTEKDHLKLDEEMKNKLVK